MNLDRMRLSFNTGNMTGSIADKLAAIHGVGFGGTTMWPADFFVHFEDLDANLEHARTSPDRSLGVILVCSRIAEVGQDSVPEILCHHSVEALDGAGTARLEGTDHIAVFFRVELGREGT